MNNAYSRYISLLLAIVVSTLVLLFPQSLTNDQNHVEHGLLSLFMLGAMIGFIHGVGFKPENKVIYYLLSPVIAWPILTAGIIYIANSSQFI
ncbi:hypothetical protein A9Q78_04940 [Methylophaga sp. 41_12_T18]|nr:hypothetical protein A9Q78_04940 [Methylophaga sp. 41_12_T18]